MKIKISERVLSTTGMVIGLCVGSFIPSILKMVNNESTCMQELPKVLAGAATAGAVLFLLIWLAKRLWGIKIL